MYGYDSVSFDNTHYGSFNGNFDENYYLEMSKPPKVENFDNVINDLITTEDNSTINNDLKAKYIEGININRYLYSSNQHLKYIIKKKDEEILYMNNQLYLLYVLLFISIILIIMQKVSFSNLQQLFEIVKLNKIYYDPAAPI
jgi:hypothetical protein